MEIIWMDIKGFEGLYMVSNTGVIKSLPKRSGNRSKGETIMKFKQNSHGYRFASLCKESKYTYRLIHRIVAECFLPNPLLLPQINHIDGNPLNNNLSNLEWCTQSQNMIHSYYVLGKVGHKNKAIEMVNDLGVVVREFLSLKDVKKGLSISSPTSVRLACIHYPNKKSYGHKWRYKA